MGRENGFSTHQSWKSLTIGSDLTVLRWIFDKSFLLFTKRRSSKPREQLRETFCHINTLKYMIYHRMRGRCSSGPVSKSCLEVWKCFVPFSYTFSIWMDTPAAPPPQKAHPTQQVEFYFSRSLWDAPIAAFLISLACGLYSSDRIWKAKT